VLSWLGQVAQAPDTVAETRAARSRRNRVRFASAWGVAAIVLGLVLWILAMRT
jgi:hypothetical protein